MPDADLLATALKVAGGRTPLARVLRVTPARVSQLRHRIPAPMRATLELYLDARSGDPSSDEEDFPTVADLRGHLARQERYLQMIPRLVKKIEDLQAQLAAHRTVMTRYEETMATLRAFPDSTLKRRVLAVMAGEAPPSSPPRGGYRRTS